MCKGILLAGADPHRNRRVILIPRGEYNFSKIAIVCILLAVGIGVCSWMVSGDPADRSAQSEANNIAVIERMDINLGDCYRWLLQFDDSKQGYVASGYDDQAASQLAVDHLKRDHTYWEYNAILTRCSVLWGQATEDQKMEAIRASGVS